MHKWMMWAMGVALAAGMAQAAGSERMIDQQLAAEILRGAVAPQAPGTLLQSQEMQQVYAGSLLQQELVQEAARRGLAERLDVSRALQQARWQLLIQALREDIGRSVSIPTEDEIKKQHAANKGKYQFEDSYKLDIWTVSPQVTNATERVRAMLAGGKIVESELAALSARQLIATSSPLWVAESSVDANIWKDLPAMKVGDLKSYLVKGEIWIIRRGEFRAKREMTYDEAKEQIKQELINDRANQAWEQFQKAKAKDLGLQ